MRTILPVSLWSAPLLLLILSALPGVRSQELPALRPGAEAGDSESQDRGVVLGFVEGRGNRKRAGADVVLISRPFPSRVDIGEIDVVRVVSDERGRFRANCLRGRAYSAWATWAGEDGHLWSTGIAEGIVPGPVVRLHQAEPSLPVELTIKGLAAWREFGEVTAMVYARSKNGFARPMEISADGKARLPFLPGTEWDVEVRAANGLLISMARARRAPMDVELSPPREWSVQVSDELGAPIAEAAVAQMPCYAVGARHWRMVPVPLAKTDAQGRAVVVLPAKNSLSNRPSAQTLEVRHEGHASRLVSLPNDPRKQAPRPTTAEVTMRSGYQLKGRIVDGRKQPIVGLEVLVEHPMELQGSERGSFGNPPQPVRTDEDGRFEVCGLTDWAGCRVMLMLRPAEARMAGFAAASDRSLAPIQWIAGFETVQGDIDLETVCLADVPMCRLTVVDHGKVPASEARVRLLREGSFGSPIEYVTDRVGRLQIAYPDTQTKIGVYVRSGGVALAAVPSPKTHAMQLQLLETRVVTGVVVDEKGAPVPGALVEPWLRLKNMDHRLADLAFRSYGAMEPTTKSGGFRVTLPFADKPFSIRATGAKPGPRMWSDLLLVGPDDKDVRLVLKVR